MGASAYRAGQCLYDERQGIEFDYSRKQGVAFSGIMAPANAPAWVKDRALLWNTVEKIENRKDSRLAKEILIALPVELTVSQNIALIQEYCQSQFIDKGMIADINIHVDNVGNPHAHILLTTRTITEQGFGLKNTEWNKRHLVFEQRKGWELLANQHLLQAGYEARIDCRSLKDRGLNVEPGLHLGPAAHHGAQQGRGDEFTRYVEHLDILRANGERVIENPQTALSKLTQQQAVFTEFDIAKLANQYSADLEQYHQVFGAIQKAPNIINLGQDDYGNSVFSTREMVALEHQLLDHAYEMDLKKGHEVEQGLAQTLVDNSTLTGEQKEAFWHLTAPGI